MKSAQDRWSRIYITSVEPRVHNGSWPIKRAIGQPVHVRAGAIVDGHDRMCAQLRITQIGGATEELMLTPSGNDEYTATFVPDSPGRYAYQVRAWVDRYGSWQHQFNRRREGGAPEEELQVELLDGAAILESYAANAPLAELTQIMAFVEACRSGNVEAALDPSCCAVLLEVVQGEGGVNVADSAYLHRVREICDERGMVFIVDEVQTGLARTGEWFAWHHHFDPAGGPTGAVRPDIVTMAKALGNGVPIGAVWARREVAAAFQPGDHATTFGGQPLAASAARAVLRTMEAIGAPAVAAARGEELAGKLMGVPGVVDTRGLGLLIAAELDTDAAGRSGPEVAAACLEAGLVINGITPTAVRFAPPLVVSSEQIDEGLAIFASVLASNGKLG